MSDTITAASEPRHLRLDDVKEGDRVTEQVVIDDPRIQAFIALTADRASVHVSAAHASAMGFPKPIAHGFLVAAPYSRLLGMFLPGANSVIQRLQLDMLGPVFADDVLTCEVRVTRITPSVGAVQLALSATNQNGTLVSRGTATCVMRTIATPHS